MQTILLELVKNNVEKMRLKDRNLGSYQEGWDDAVCVVLDVIDIYLKGEQIE